jgi:RNA polymerase sigma-70 factor (ECF subfamily)
MASHEPTPDRELERRYTAARVRQALASLNVEQRTVLDLFELEGFSCEEVSQIMGVPVGTTYSRLSRARKAFGRVVARERLRGC